MAKDSNSSSLSPNQSLDSMSMRPSVMPCDQEDYIKVSRERLQLFWERQMNFQLDEGVESVLPHSLIRKIMKSNAETISRESSMVMAKACEFLIEELTYLSWMSAQDANKHTLTSFDLFKALFESGILNFTSKKEDNAGNFAQGIQPNAGNFAEGNQNALPHATGFMGNSMMNMGNNPMAMNQHNVGNQVVLPHAADGFMGNDMLNMENNQVTTYQQNGGNFIEGNQASLPHVDGPMENPMMNMEIVRRLLDFYERHMK